MKRSLTVLKLWIALQRRDYDIVFTDVRMPEMNGLEATRQVIATWGAERPWITALTASALKKAKKA